MKTKFKNNNDGDSNDSKGIQSISNHEERKYDTIPFRLDFIKDLLKDNNLEPIINFDNLETETFIHPNGYLSSDSPSNAFNAGSLDSNTNHDIRNILNKKKYDFHKVITDIGGKLRYIKSGSSGHTFKGIIVTETGVNINYAVKVVPYPKKERYGDFYDARRPENAELMMIRLLSYFVIKKQTPHITLPIGTFYTSIAPFVNLIGGNYVDKENKRYQEFIDRYKKGEYYDTVSILISEWANRGDLLDFIKKNYKEFTTLHWKVIFFQIISVLAVIQSKFPTFRHNDMKANNFLIHKIEQRGTLFTYVVCRKRYLIPNIGYQVKLWDYDFACIPGIVENSKVAATWTDEINVKPVENKYYDLHYFFNTLIKRGFFPELLEDPSIAQEIKDFVNRIVPLKYQTGDFVAKKGRILVDDEFVCPNDVLKNDPLFEEFRNYKPKKKNSEGDNKSGKITGDNKKKVIDMNKNETSEFRKKYVLSP